MVILLSIILAIWTIWFFTNVSWQQLTVMMAICAQAVLNDPKVKQLLISAPIEYS